MVSITEPSTVDRLYLPIEIDDADWSADTPSAPLASIASPVVPLANVKDLVSEL